MTRLIEVLLMTLAGAWQGLRQDFNLLEIALIALGFWAWKRDRLPRFRWRLPRFGRKMTWKIAVLIALATIALRLALLPLLHAPVPVVSDEFSHLLLADTLLDGRVANPTHAFWQHFETLHVIQQPHYGSDYFPGHAAVLAGARALAGAFEARTWESAAWAGVLAECGAFLLALYWMLSGWMPARWALAGTGLAALRFGIGSYWVNAYHGGFLCAIGGALIAGAFPRLSSIPGLNRDRKGAEHPQIPLVDAHGSAGIAKSSSAQLNRDRKGAEHPQIPLVDARGSAGIAKSSSAQLNRDRKGAEHPQIPLVDARGSAGIAKSSSAQLNRDRKGAEHPQIPLADARGSVGIAKSSSAQLNRDRKGAEHPQIPLADARGSVGKTFALGAIFGLGLAILAVTRPFEGALYSIPWVAMLAWKLRWRTWRPAIPAILIAGAAVLAIGVYFDRVTGSPFVTAYQINQKAYGWPMGLAWTTPPKIEFRNIELARYYQYELGEREKVDGPLDFLEYLTFRIQEYWRFFLGPVLTVPLLMISAVWRRRRMLFIGLAGAVFAILLEGAASPHYLAPATAVIVAIVVECCRVMSATRYARRIPIVPMAALAMALVLALRIGAQNLGLPYTQALNYQSWCCKVDGNLNKARIAHELEQIPGRHLVFVKTKTDEMNLLQWIYNAADIDAARIVWARDLGPERDAALAAYFRGRQVWMVDPNREPAALTKYNDMLAIKYQGAMEKR